MSNVLHPDRETIIIGGFGSDSQCVRKAAGNLSTVMSRAVHGITNSEARRHFDSLAEFSEGKNLIPYSGSATLAANLVLRAGANPESISFVSPPDTISRYAAVHGFVRAALAKNGEMKREESSARQLARFSREILSHPDNYYRLIHEARRFEQLAAAISLRSMGVQTVNLIVPRGDEMFSNYELPLDRSPDDNVEGVRYVVIEGGHTRFSNDTAGVFLEAEAAPFAEVTEESLANNMPERTTTPPTIVSAVQASLQGLRTSVMQLRTESQAA